METANNPERNVCELLKNYSAKELAYMLIDAKEMYNDAEERLNIALDLMTDNQVDEFERQVDLLD